MFYQKPLSITLTNFGPFVGEHSVKLPENGLLLIKGKVTETGDGSGAGKSFLLNSIPYVLGGCPFASTELQSWYTDEPPSVEILFDTQEGIVTLSRKKGLAIKGLKEVLKGKAAEAELNRLFGMDDKIRAQVTYRGQRKPGLFLSMSDPDKKSFLSKLLDLSKYETVETQAKKALDTLEKELSSVESTCKALEEAYNSAKDSFQEVNVDFAQINKIESEKKLLLEEKAKVVAKKEALLKEIENYRKKCEADTEAAVVVVRKKIQDLASQPLPEEVIALRKEEAKLQQRLEKCRKHDEEKRLEVANQRALLNQELVKVLAEYDAKIAQFVADTKQTISEKQNDLLVKTTDIRNQKVKAESDLKLVISRNKQVKLKLEQLQKEEKQLIISLCPTCSQMWANAKSKLEENKAEQDKLQLEHTQLNHTEADLEQLIAYTDGKIVAVAKESETITNNIREDAKLKLALLKQERNQFEDNQKLIIGNIQDPEPHPAGKQIKSALEATTKAITEAESETKKRQQEELNRLYKEEKEVKLLNSNLFNARKQDLEKDTQVLDIASFDSKVQQLDGRLLTLQKQQLLHAEREAIMNRANEKYKDALNRRLEVTKKANLEADIIALVGRNGFLGAIFADVLTEISAQCNDILGQVANVRHLTIDFETEKEAVTTGNVSARITPVIYNRGRKVTFDAGISGGMQAAVELAVDLAVGNVVSSRRGAYPSFLILDESLHGLGGVAKESCIEMLQSVAGERLVLVVDHSTEFCNLFNQVIEVAQEDGKSWIV